MGTAESCGETEAGIGEWQGGRVQDPTVSRCCTHSRVGLLGKTLQVTFPGTLYPANIYLVPTVCQAPSCTLGLRLGARVSSYKG